MEFRLLRERVLEQVFRSLEAAPVHVRRRWWWRFASFLAATAAVCEREREEFMREAAPVHVEHTLFTDFEPSEESDKERAYDRLSKGLAAALEKARKSDVWSLARHGMVTADSGAATLVWVAEMACDEAISGSALRQRLHGVLNINEGALIMNDATLIERVRQLQHGRLVGALDKLATAAEEISNLEVGYQTLAASHDLLCKKLAAALERVRCAGLAYPVPEGATVNPVVSADSGPENLAFLVEIVCSEAISARGVSDSSGNGRDLLSAWEGDTCRDQIRKLASLLQHSDIKPLNILRDAVAEIRDSQATNRDLREALSLADDAGYTAVFERIDALRSELELETKHKLLALERVDELNKSLNTRIRLEGTERSRADELGKDNEELVAELSDLRRQVKEARSGLAAIMSTSEDSDLLHLVGMMRGYVKCQDQHREHLRNELKRAAEPPTDCFGG
jgi:hypothetical protein